ncbi:MAG TPA: OpgC domain-containing protein [Thermoleophilaceae bacterium]|nr:OpgC domain-containing protein [Thermoleophilaceae bacterium]
MTLTPIQRTARAPADAALYVPREWELAPLRRDVALDLLRGLAVLVLVVNHIHLESVLEYATATVLSAAEVLVGVSGIVVAMVHRRRWAAAGPRAVTGMLLRRARKLYLASVAVVAICGALTAVPALQTEALTVSPGMDAQRDLYAFDGAARTIVAVVTLEAGPWQFSILGLFIALLALTPALLWMLARGLWPLVVAASWLAFLAGRELGVDVLPTQSERPFPLLVWQLLFVHGLVAGWHRRRISQAVGPRRRLAGFAVAATGLACASALVAAELLVDDAAWAAWRDTHFDKGSLDLLRVVAMASVAGALYVAMRWRAASAERLLGPVLLPLGRNSFYVFIVHVFVCLAVASVPVLAGGGVGPLGNALVQAACVTAIWAMASRGVLFRWIPR